MTVRHLVLPAFLGLTFIAGAQEIDPALEKEAERQASETFNALTSQTDGSTSDKTHACEGSDSIESVMTTFYGSISGPVGAPRDWETFRSLFISGARLGRQNAERMSGLSQFDVDAYIESSNKVMVERGFVETETGRVTNLYGNLANVASAYEIRFMDQTADHPPITGVNFFHLVRVGHCWRITDGLWQPRTGALPPVSLAPEVR